VTVSIHVLPLQGGQDEALVSTRQSTRAAAAEKRVSRRVVWLGTIGAALLMWGLIAFAASWLFQAVF
jgi:hypothetical protein